VLVIPRGDGLLVVVDGESYAKPMTSHQYIQLAMRCLQASLEVNDETVQAQERARGSERE
jgi:hypothetical protein